jgi:RNA polymerase sigma factor (TIGR02999 family)
MNTTQESPFSSTGHSLFPLAYQELRGIAARYLRRERAGQTLQPTALVHEAYLRLLGAGQRELGGSQQLLAAAARAMRHILVERARRRQAQKYGGR